MRGLPVTSYPQPATKCTQLSLGKNKPPSYFTVAFLSLHPKGPQKYTVEFSFSSLLMGSLHISMSVYHRAGPGLSRDNKPCVCHTCTPQSCCTTSSSTFSCTNGTSYCPHERTKGSIGEFLHPLEAELAGLAQITHLNWLTTPELEQEGTHDLLCWLWWGCSRHRWGGSKQRGGYGGLQRQGLLPSNNLQLVSFNRSHDTSTNSRRRALRVTERLCLQTSALHTPRADACAEHPGQLKDPQVL